MKNAQKRHEDEKAGDHATPKPPVTPRLCLIVLGHKAILLPLRLRAKGKWGVAAAWLGYSGVAHYELSRHASRIFVGRLCQTPITKERFTETPYNLESDEPGQAF